MPAHGRDEELDMGRCGGIREEEEEEDEMEKVGGRVVLSRQFVPGKWSMQQLIILTMADGKLIIKLWKKIRDKLNNLSPLHLTV